MKGENDQRGNGDFCLLFEGGMDDSSVYTLLVFDRGILTKGKKVQNKQVTAVT